MILLMLVAAFWCLDQGVIAQSQIGSHGEEANYEYVTEIRRHNPQRFRQPDFADYGTLNLQLGPFALEHPTDSVGQSMQTGGGTGANLHLLVDEGGARQGQESSAYSSYGAYYPEQPTNVYIPVPIQMKKKQKSKIISVVKGMYIQGGQQVFGTFQSAKKCMKYCSSIPNCFSGDFNKWLYKCYIHTNVTACGALQANPSLVHFSKVPCTSNDINPSSNLVILGAQLALGLEMKGVDDLKTCIKKCVNAGRGIASTTADLNTQICFALVFDFSTHKCYLFSSNTYAGTANYFCATTAPINTPVRDLTPNPNTIFIDFCPPIVAPPPG